MYLDGKILKKLCEIGKNYNNNYNDGDLDSSIIYISCVLACFDNYSIIIIIIIIYFNNHTHIPLPLPVPDTNSTHVNLYLLLYLCFLAHFSYLNFKSHNNIA